jgi:hypothetical protein
MSRVVKKTTCFTFKSSVRVVPVCSFLSYHYIYAIAHIFNNPIVTDLLLYLTKLCNGVDEDSNILVYDAILIDNSYRNFEGS